jgi:flagellar basal body-associated protein FliL
VRVRPNHISEEKKMKKLLWILFALLVAALIFGPQQVIDFIKAIPLYVWLTLGVFILITAIIALFILMFIKNKANQAKKAADEAQESENFMTRLIEEQKARTDFERRGS